MKSLLLAATVAAGVLCSASSADAQFRYRNRGVTYSSPAYSYPTYSSYSYSSPTYGYPTYSYSYPSYYSSGVTTSSYYYPSTSVYSGYPNTWGSSYGSPYGGWGNQYYGTGWGNQYYGNQYYGNPYGSGYYDRGININPSGIFLGGRRVIDW